MRSTGIIVCSCILLLACATELLSQAPAPKRVWKDASGMFSIEAEFLGLAEGKVSLRKVDGKVISLPLDKLSPADQAAAQQLAEPVAPSPATPAAQVPLDENKLPIAAKVVWGDAPTASVVAKEIESIDIANSLRDLDRKPVPWKAPAFTPPPLLTLPPKAINLNYRGWSVDEHDHRLKIDPSRSCLWISRAYKGRESSDFRLDRIDLGTGSFLSAFAMPSEQFVLAIDATGKRLVTVGKGELSLWKLDGDQLIRQKSLALLEQKDSTDTIFSPQSGTGTFVGPDHFALLNGSGLYVIKLADFQPTLRICFQRQMQGLATLFLPGSRQMVIAESHLIMLVDIPTGKLNGTIIAPNNTSVKQAGKLALSSDCRWLYVDPLGDDVLVYDLRTGKLAKSIELLDGTNWGTTIAESPPGMLRYGGHGLIDLSRGLPLVQVRHNWRLGYRQRWRAHLSAGGRDFYLINGAEWDEGQLHERKGGLALIIAEIPDAALKAKFSTLKADDYRLLKPGDKVAVVYDPAHVSDNSEKLLPGTLTKKLAGTGATLVKDPALATHEFRYTFEVKEGYHRHRVILVQKATDKSAEKNLWEDWNHPLNPGEDAFKDRWLETTFDLNLNPGLLQPPTDGIFKLDLTPTGLKEFTHEELQQKREDERGESKAATNSEQE
ncbi:SHD1 domain-containing protein [Anatilimnocola sp. NA78]|uniref:SHD1 domain-containing protein n=1 Tax=Anatilimnocola sp. NA78 TaxID=3415683 RepID=UPI003CE4E2FF